MQRYLIIAGLFLLVAGLFWPFLIKIPFGRLPGDIIVRRPNFTFYFPITTMVVVSILLSIVFRLFKK